jgi:hypothetical protein
VRNRTVPMRNIWDVSTTETAPGSDVGRYQRHLPEQKLLLEQHYPQFVAHVAGECRLLTDYVRREFEEYLLHGCPTMAKALKIFAISRYKDPAKLYCCAE